VDSAASFVQWQQDPDARDLDVVFGAAHIFHVPIGLALRRTCFIVLHLLYNGSLTHTSFAYSHG
jgi:hypothetical protein